MINLKKKNLILFDVDGVLFDSKKNMFYAWNKTKIKHNLNINFKHYFSKIGIPFKDILISLGIKKNLKAIERTYSNESSKKIHLVKSFPYAQNVLKGLLKSGKKIGIVTSKHKNRTKKLIKMLNLKFTTIQCPTSRLKGKPNPDQLLKALREAKISSSSAIYVGDMDSDYKASKNAKIDFVFAEYGYGFKKKHYKNVIKNLRELKNDKIF